MPYTSLVFLLFLPAAFALYWTVRRDYRWMVLITTSLFFYGYFIPWIVIVLVASVLMNYALGLWIGSRDDSSKRRQALVTGVTLNVLMLAGFRYFSTITASQEILYTLVIPLGISFYTFTAISYLVEVKRRTLLPERHLGFFTVYLTFFPKLIQGPIERPGQFLPQCREYKVFDEKQAADGLRLILWGFFKKLVIADRLAIVVNSVYEAPRYHSAPVVILATVFYAIQIYADFSGYIDIARGLAKLFGFNLSRNFNRPYAATSVKDFWQRWHITFSTWLRDYIFLPLAYSLSRI